MWIYYMTQLLEKVVLVVSTYSTRLLLIGSARNGTMLSQLHMVQNLLQHILQLIRLLTCGTHYECLENLCKNHHGYLETTYQLWTVLWSPSGKLQKQHNILNYHCVCEAQAAGIINFVHIDGKENPADTTIKHTSSCQWYENHKTLDLLVIKRWCNWEPLKQGEWEIVASSHLETSPEKNL